MSEKRALNILIPSAESPRIERYAVEALFTSQSMTFTSIISEFSGIKLLDAALASSPST
jgi:hypothetical protein